MFDDLQEISIRLIPPVIDDRGKPAELNARYLPVRRWAKGRVRKGCSGKQPGGNAWGEGIGRSDELRSQGEPLETVKNFGDASLAPGGRQLV